MLKLTLAIGLYAIAMFAIYAAIPLAPVIGWPTTPDEYLGCYILVFGMIAKTVGHLVLLK